MKILVINGPNINMLGIREPSIYGNKTYKDLVNTVEDYGKSKGIEIKCFQSNWEGKIIDEIQGAYGIFDGIIINPAAYTHTSIGILDALKAVNLPTVEVHLSKVEDRESYRQISYVREHALKTISGKGIEGYLEAIDYLKSI